METDGTTEILFKDDFSAYPAAALVDGPYLQRLASAAQPVSAIGRRLGPWRETTLHYSWRSPRTGPWRDGVMSWRLADRDGRRWLEQPENFFNAMLTAGDPDWDDYVLEVTVTVGDRPAGPVVRYRSSRQNYWLSLRAGAAPELVRRDQDEHVVLASAPGPVLERDRAYRCRICCRGGEIAVTLDGAALFEAGDDSFARGAVALRTEGPAAFTDLVVRTDPDTAARLRAAARAREKRLAAIRAARPAPTVLHRVPLPAEGTVFHLADVNDDGRAELLACNIEVPQTDYMRLARMEARRLDGSALWSFGEPLDSRHAVHGAFAFNLGDIDGDGHTEIIVTRDFELLIIDGRTGAVKRRGPTPETFLGREDLFPRTVGDSILVCNLRGLETPRDFILKDRYRNLWAYTDQLKPLWHRHLNTGHYVRARDLDGDGRDEVMAGYSLLDADGFTRWTVPGASPDINSVPGIEHADSILMERFGPGADAPLMIAMAASDFGFVLLDAEGRLKCRHRVGHAQWVAAAPFRPDLPGRQFLVRTFWGNNGIMNLFDCEGRLLLAREIPAASCHPVRWPGFEGALILAGNQLLDGHFRPVADLPETAGGAHPSAYDINGDGFDEIISVRDNTLLVIGNPDQAVDPPAGPLPSLTNWNIYGGFYR